MEEYNKILANKYYNIWLSDFDSSEDFGDSTTFSCSDDDILNGKYIIDNDIKGAIGFNVEEVATVYITKNKKLAIDILMAFEDGICYEEEDNFIIIG